MARNGRLAVRDAGHVVTPLAPTSRGLRIAARLGRGAGGDFAARLRTMASRGAGIALGIACTAGVAAAAPPVDSLPPFSFSVSSGATSLALSAQGRSPALRTGPLAWRWLSEASGRRGFTGARVHALTGGIVASLPEWRDAWLGLGLRRGTFLGSDHTTPSIEAGAHLHWSGAAIRFRARHRWVDVPHPPRLIETWTSPPGFHSPPDSIPDVPYWEASDPSRTGITSVDAALQWGRRGWEVEAGGGLALARGLGPIRTARIEAIRWLESPWGVMAGISGSAPRWLTGEVADGPSAWLGVRVDPGRAAMRVLSSPPRWSRWRWSVLAVGGGYYAFRLQASGAARIALRADFTDWEPVLLGLSPSGWWEVWLPVTAGIHQIEISVDGAAWRPPPGVPTMASTYGAEVGIFVAQ